MTRVEIELDDETQSAIADLREAGVDPKTLVKNELKRYASAKKTAENAAASFLHGVG